MVVYFVRHGHPNYKDDILTPLGRLQAEAASQKLVTYGIEKVFSSTKGRALETASYTAEKLGLEIVPCDFIREINWTPSVEEPVLLNGHPWRLAEHFTREGIDLRLLDPKSDEPFCNTHLSESIHTVRVGIDEWLAQLGFQREGAYYRITKATPHAVAIFSHGGAQAAAFSHILNIPFMQMCKLISFNFTSITAVSFCGEVGELCYPNVILSTAEHINGITVENEFGN